MNRDYGHDAATTHDDAAMQVVMVGLGDEKFALDAGLVREIIAPIPATQVAGARSFLPSVINVRGNVFPLAGLRIRFGMPISDDSADTRIVVIEINIDGDLSRRCHRRQGLRNHGNPTDRCAADAARWHALEAGVHPLHHEMA